jgi:hypothetical protein
MVGKDLFSVCCLGYDRKNKGNVEYFEPDIDLMKDEENKKAYYRKIMIKLSRFDYLIINPSLIKPLGTLIKLLKLKYSHVEIVTSKDKYSESLFSGYYSNFEGFIEEIQKTKMISKYKYYVRGKLNG